MDQLCPHRLVKKTAIGLEAAVVQLRQAVVRSVRTSTSSVNRRKLPRREVNLAARIACGGSVLDDAQLLDLSPCGALIRCAKDIYSGAHGRLVLDGMDLPFVVRKIRERGIFGVKFMIDQAQEHRISLLMEAQPSISQAA